MAYADQEMSGNRVIALIVVALIHIAVGYVLVTGLAYEAVKKAVERVTTVDIEEPEPEEEEPPPPPEEVPDFVPPPVVPPAPINLAPPSPVQTRDEPPPRPDPVFTQPAPVGPPPPPPAPPPPPPPPKFTPKDPTPRGSPGRWVSNRDYPSRAEREEREGTTRFRVNVGANGRVTNCSVTGSSGHSDLDAAACKLITRRARFRPATNGEGNEVAGTWSSAFRWEIPR